MSRSIFAVSVLALAAAWKAAANAPDPAEASGKTAEESLGHGWEARGDFRPAAGAGKTDESDAGHR